ncbi:hypothetical protein OG905_24605 [Streptomyces sp. NBC_00322]|uniref:hypothetical protein n=1 Tax=Streptomyces sp. NBC_00322 TaxID=2975712 RepID=UPI002E28C479|nr:hypothetical protein [Streptomyces sp. NBC_00322]
MAWDEWEQLKSEAADRHTTQMRLNQLPADPGGGGGGQPDFVANQDDLGAVGHEAFILHDLLGKQADIAGAGMDKQGAGSTMQAAGELKNHNFTFGFALETTVSVWDTQLKSLLQACAHISNHLDYSKALHAKDDAQVAISLHNRDGSAVPASELNKYFT